jgi:MFS family permease
MGACSFFIFFFLIYASLRWFPRRGHAVLMGMANSLGMIGWLIGNCFIDSIGDLLGNRLSFCIFVFFLVYMGIILSFAFKRETKNKEQFAKAVIWVTKDAMFWCFGCISLGFYMGMHILSVIGNSLWFRDIYGHVTGILSLFLFLGLGIGGPCIGYFSDRISKRRAYIIALYFLQITAVGIILYCSPLSIGVLSILAFIIGVCSSGYLLLYTLAIDYSHPKAKGVSALLMSVQLLAGGFLGGSFVELSSLFVWFVLLSIFVLRIKDPPPEMEHSHKILERLFAKSQNLSNP